MNQFILEELVNVDKIINHEQKRKDVQRLFIFKLDKIEHNKIFDHLFPNKEYASVRFTQFTVIMFKKRYKLPKKLLKYKNLQFKIQKFSNNLNQHDFVFKFLIGNLKFELDEVMNSQYSVKQRLHELNKQNKESIKEPELKNNQTEQINEIIQQNDFEEMLSESSQISDVKNKLSKMESELVCYRNEFESYKVEKQKRDDENIELKNQTIILKNENIDLKNQNIALQNQANDLKRKFCELEQVEQHNFLENNERYCQQQNKIEKLIAVFQIQQNQMQQQQNQMQLQQNQIQAQQNQIQEQQNYIQEQKKLSAEKQQKIEEQYILIKQEQEDKVAQIQKKPTEKNEIIQMKEEEQNDQNKKLNICNQTIQFIVNCMPESWNTIREKMYNYQNNNIKQFRFDNFNAVEQFIKQQYNQKNSTPFKYRTSTPTTTPNKKIKTEQK